MSIKEGFLQKGTESDHKTQVLHRVFPFSISIVFPLVCKDKRKPPFPKVIYMLLQRIFDSARLNLARGL